MEPWVRSRAERWLARNKAKVSHPAHGTVVVPHLSNYAAIMNAAEFWRCDFMEIAGGCKVTVATAEDGPVRRPREFYR